jgi:integrase
MDRPFAQAVAAAGLEAEITPHVMRHTAITALVQAGVDLPTIQRISGHKTLAMVMRYSHVHGLHILTAPSRRSAARFPELPEHETARTITPRLHRGRLRAIK